MWVADITEHNSFSFQHNIKCEKQKGTNDADQEKGKVVVLINARKIGISCLCFDL